MKTQVKLLSWPHHPLVLLWSLWEHSRNNHPMEELETTRMHVSPKQLAEHFRKMLNMGIPLLENITFTFLLDGVSVSLREQLVRHRIGTRVGDNFGVDIVPDLASSSWWAQSMRILDMGHFYESGRFLLPETIRGMAEQEYLTALENAELAYQNLVDLGVPLEDARNVIPLAATHRISWTLNLGALKHIVGKRGCWILQLGLWKPVILGMIEELALKISPIFRELITPPCVSRNEMGKPFFKSCVFKHDNERRIQGLDEIPPCALYLEQHEEEAIEAVIKAENDPNRNEYYWAIGAGDWKCYIREPGVDMEKRDQRNARFEAMREEYEKLWGFQIDEL